MRIETGDIIGIGVLILSLTVSFILSDFTVGYFFKEIATFYMILMKITLTMVIVSPISVIIGTLVICLISVYFMIKRLYLINKYKKRI